MPEWSDVPVFGVRPADEAPVRRPSAYGLVSDARGKLAVVSTPQGVFLPGGGIEPGETLEGAICREAVEECGLVLRLGDWKRRAIQLVHSEAEATCFEKLSTFVSGVVARAGAPGVEAEHELRWVEPAAAVALLTPESHRWAVEELQRDPPT